MEPRYLGYAVERLITSKVGDPITVSRLENGICMSQVRKLQRLTLRSNERLDPHKRLVQLDFLEKIRSVHGQLRLLQGDSYEEEEETRVGGIKATKT